MLVLVALLAPGLDEVREALGRADPGWIALAVAFEVLSGVSYVLMFRPIFCRRMSWRTSWEIAWVELGVGSISGRLLGVRQRRAVGDLCSRPSGERS